MDFRSHTQQSDSAAMAATLLDMQIRAQAAGSIIYETSSPIAAMPLSEPPTTFSSTLPINLTSLIGPQFLE